jgi:hypothetical protein
MKRVFVVVLKYLVAAGAIGAALYFGIKQGDPAGLRIETSGL